MESKFKNKIHIAVSGTRHTVKTDKNKVIHRKLISNPLPFQQTTTTPAKKINTRQNTADQPTCSKTLDKAATSGAPCIYSKKEAPKNTANYERSEDWSKRKEIPRNNKGQFTSPNKNTANLNLSIISDDDDDDDDFECYNKEEGKPIQVNIEDELQLHPKETNLTPEQGSYKGKNRTEKPIEPVRRSNRLPFAKQTEKLGGIPYHISNNKKKLTNHGNLLQETTAETAERSEMENDRPMRKNYEEIRTIRPLQQTPIGLLRRGGNVISCRYHDLQNHEPRQRAHYCC